MENRMSAEQETRADIPTDVAVLLERQVHSALLRHGFNAFVGSAYSDPESAGHREIDVLGVVSRTIQDRIPVFLHVLIECKKWTSGPLVGIGGAPTRNERYRVPEEFHIAHQDPVRSAMQSGKARARSFYHFFGLNTKPHPVAYSDLLATQLVLMERGKTWVAKNTGIYDSVVLPLVKAQSNYSNIAQILAPPGDGDFAVSFTRSALVTTAPLRGVQWINDEHTNITHPHFFPVIRNFSAKSMPLNFTFEVVSAEHLEAWLSTQVVPFFNAICDAVDEWLNEGLGS
jgi:hypothetical protein